MEELVKIQSSLKAPKSRTNTHQKYSYRSCEDILESLKPILKELSCFVLLSDEIIAIGDRFYVKSTATIVNKEGVRVSVSAFAREDTTSKGMESAKITGASSSYARKYALNGLFAIDDTKDPDSYECNERTHKTEPIPSQPTAQQKQRKVINDALLDNRERLDKMLSVLDEAYRKNPATFAVIKHLRDDLGFEFENHAEERVMAIWMQHIEELN